VRVARPGDIGHERLLRQGVSRDAWDRASAYVLRETDEYVRDRVITVCIGDQHPAVMAKRVASATGTREQVALAGIVRQLKAGLDALGRHYAGEAAPEAA
jgi:capsid protein